MVPPKAPDEAKVLPSIPLLPASDHTFVQAIDDIALIAGGLIESVDAALLTIAVPIDRWTGEQPLMVWNQRLEASPQLAGTLADTPIFAVIFEALCMAVDSMADRLDSWGWSYIDAPGLCLVTDGVGVVLSTVRPPEQADCGWLLDLARPGSEAITVRPPQANGVWSLVVAEAHTAH